MNGGNPEVIARALEESRARLAGAPARPWEDRPAQERKALTDAVAELVERGVIAPGMPDEEGDSKWEREVWTSQTDLPKRFYDEGMLWLANRVLHPFGWALGIVVEDLEGSVRGLLISKTSDPEGVVTPTATEVEARRRFFDAQRARALAAPAQEPSPGQGPQMSDLVCPSCGYEKWQHASGDSGCPNPRCREHKPVRRD